MKVSSLHPFLCNRPLQLLPREIVSVPSSSLVLACELFCIIEFSRSARSEPEPQGPSIFLLWEPSLLSQDHVCAGPFKDKRPKRRAAGVAARQTRQQLSWELAVEI